MDTQLEDEIHKSRVILQDPYAYLDGDGQYSAISHEKNPNVYEARRILQNQYAYLDADGGYGEYSHAEDRTTSNQILIDPKQINFRKREGGRYSRVEIKNIVRKLQRKMWMLRNELVPAKKEVGAMDILNPSLALKSLGLSTNIVESLGQYSSNGELVEVAGILDHSNNQVQISRRFSPVIRNFTTAHELGHTVLHKGSGLHRDRALDGTPNNTARDSKEIEADIFAAYFLMPEKQVRSVFQKIFLIQPFVIEENTVFALTTDSLDVFQKRCRTLRELTRILASAERYNGIPVVSLAKQFNVSVEAMAIRLEELDLVKM